MSIQPDQKTDLLFKQFTGVANIFHDPTPFSGQPKAFIPYVLNESVFSEPIPKNLIDISGSNGFFTIYGSQALDASYGDSASNVGLSVDLGNNLRYYHRLPLDSVESSDQAYNKIDNSINLLQDTIPFKYDAEYDSFAQILYIRDTTTNTFQFQPLGGGVYKWLMDYQSGYIQFYGDTTDIILSSNEVPCLSFIAYVGPKGAASTGGGDTSFNNVIIDGSLNANTGIFDHLTVNETANLPEETLINPRFDKLSGTHITSHPFFNPEYPVTKQFDSFNINNTINPITENDWITIARCGEAQAGNADGRADALFKVTHQTSGRHETITFIATKKYGRGFAINVLQHDWYSGPNFKALRIAYNSTYQGGVIQLQFTSRLSTTNFNHPLCINIMHNYDYPGWELYTDISGSRTADGREVFYLIPDNNPESQNTDASGIVYPLDNEFKLENLDWDPNAGILGGANQMTTNPARFTRQVDVGGDLTVNGHNIRKVVEYPFYSEAPPTSAFWPTGATGSQTGYYKFASLDNLKTINNSKPNMAETVTHGTFTFFTKLNFEDSGYNASNKLQFRGSFNIGVNQTYQNAIFDDEGHIHTHNCMTQTGTPFNSIIMLRNSSNNKYELYIHYISPGTANSFRDKVLNLTVTLHENDNINPTDSNLEGTRNAIVNWELENLTRFSSLPAGHTCVELNLNNNGERIWSGSNKPIIGDDKVSTFGNNIMNRYTYGDNGNDVFDNDGRFIAQVYAGDGNNNNFREVMVNGDFKLLAKYEDTVTGETYTQEVMFKAGVHCSGSTTRNQNAYLNVIQNTISHEGSHLLNYVYLRTDGGGGYYFFYITVERNLSLTSSMYLDIQITNNNENSFAAGGDTATWWGINPDTGGTGLTGYIKRVNISKSSITAFNNDALHANTFITGGGDDGECIITENQNILGGSIQTDIASDGNHVLIHQTNDGIAVIDASTNGTSGGLKIFNSGGSYPNTLGYPSLTLTPFKNSGGAGTLGNPTIIQTNDDESTLFLGSGNLSLYSGPQNFGNFNVYQGNASQVAASNVIHSEHDNGNEYMLSFNHSRNDTDVVINTPSYNILNVDSNFLPDPNPAMIADSGDNTITFNAPVIFNNDVNSNSIALMEEFTFNTSNISPDDWFTLAQTGDGSDRNQLRSDGKFILEDRLGSRHHTLIFKAGAKFNSGIYINVLESSWFATPRIKALRIAYNSTYDGTVLQAQLNSDAGSQSSSNFKLRIYQNRNSHGWVSDISGSPSSENSPTCYVVNNSSNGFGTAYPNFRESGNVIYDPNNRNTTQTTTNNVVVQQSTLTVENSSGVNIECNQSPGNIVLDTIGNTVPPTGATRGISLASHEGMLLQCNNDSGVSDPGVFVVDGNVWYFNTGGFNMNGKNVDNADRVEAQTFTRRDNTTTYKKITFGTYDIANSQTYSRFLEPIVFKNNTNPSNSETYLQNLSDNSEEGAVIYARNTQVPADNTAALFNEFIFGGGQRTPVYLTPPTIKKMSTALISGSKTHPYSVTTSSPVYISGAEDMSQFSIDSAWNNTGLAIHWIPGCNGFLDRIVMNPYRSRVRITSGSGTKVIQFETWIINSTRGYSNMVNSTVTEYAVQFANHTYTTTSTNVQYRSYPFNDGSGQPRVYKTSQKLKILEGETYSLYCVIRLASGPSITCTFSNSQAGSGSSWPNGAIPMTFDLYCHLHCEL